MKKKLTLDTKSDEKVIPPYLTFEEFCQIDFGLQVGERFAIVNDVISYLTGVKYINDVRPLEIDENKRTTVFPTAGSDEELQNYKEAMPEY